ncbi:MAG: Eco57I restriction-modification methylase domain-containing protein [Selenomonadaceae bacterium]|nr:Eco57I restriction-modification methylase domain-containing protein [Selenomonadaceae bacterium]
MSNLIQWNEYPLRNVFDILRGKLKVGKSVVPRAEKSVDEKFLRSDAEVFTPPEVVKFMVDAFELENIFWQARVESKCLEVACGEAPFITTRYDAESGEKIPVDERVGILDRKFQAVPANVDKNFWAKRAVQSVYGYELQADSLLIARANVLLSFVEFVEKVSADELRDIAEIISRNFWLMDGLKLPDATFSLFDDTPEIKIVDWFDDEREIFFGGNVMKFDFLISNPPYQDDTKGGNKNFSSPLYDKFMDAAPKIADKSVLITPARFLFDAGATPKEFNRRMLNNPHLKVLDYAPDARKYFRNVDIEGGVAITLQDETKNFGAIGTFIPWNELRSASEKVTRRSDFKPLSDIIYPRTAYSLTPKVHKDFPNAKRRFSAGNQYQMSSNVFDLMPEIFFDEKPDDGNEYIQLYGRQNNQRVYKFVRRDYVTEHESLNKWKVFISKANGASGKLVDNEAARLISPPDIGEPNQGCTQTFITVGAFDTRDEAENCLTYIKSKFARVMLGILKVTQDNTPEKWAKVPLQDFSASSDIDWRGDVDGQLYRKYNLSDAEINFIESHVKEMP